MMLEQLAPRPGHRVLELGAGTGYNAALLAHLVGRHGHVTTIDVDDEARSRLAAAGVDDRQAQPGVEGRLVVGYRHAIPLAEQRYERYLKERAQEEGLP